MLITFVVFVERNDKNAARFHTLYLTILPFKIHCYAWLKKLGMVFKKTGTCREFVTNLMINKSNIFYFIRLIWVV